MKTVHIINKGAYLITLFLYITIYLGLIAQIILGILQIILAIYLLVRYWKDSSVKDMLSWYALLISLYFFSCFALWKFKIDNHLVGYLFMMILPMSIGGYFLYITSQLRKKTPVMSYNIPNWLIVAGGIGQIFTALIYPYIRHKVFDWYKDIKQLKPLNQEIVKTYGRYIQGLNFSFGCIAILLTNDLQNGTKLAIAITGLIGAYWIGKVATQVAYYPMSTIPQKPLFKIGSYLMNALFLLFAVVFAGLLLANCILYFNP